MRPAPGPLSCDVPVDRRQRTGESCAAGRGGVLSGITWFWSSSLCLLVSRKRLSLSHWP
jgi:hypothetical protein